MKDLLKILKQQGHNDDFDAIRIHRLHEYHYPWRDFASVVGLGLIMIVWVASFVRGRRSQK